MAKGIKEKLYDSLKNRERKLRVEQAKKKEKKAMKKFDYVMNEYSKGRLHQGKTGKTVPKNRPDIAAAIAYSEQRKKNKK